MTDRPTSKQTFQEQTAVVLYLITCCLPFPYERPLFFFSFPLCFHPSSPPVIQVSIHPSSVCFIPPFLYPSLRFPPHIPSSPPSTHPTSLPFLPRTPSFPSFPHSIIPILHILLSIHPDALSFPRHSSNYTSSRKEKQQQEMKVRRRQS